MKILPSGEEETLENTTLNPTSYAIWHSLLLVVEASLWLKAQFWHILVATPHSRSSQTPSSCSEGLPLAGNAMRNHLNREHPEIFPKKKNSSTPLFQAS